MLNGEPTDEVLEIPGNISIISKNNGMVHGPSLIQDIWEYDHDPHDYFIWDFIRSKEQNLSKRHSYQDIKRQYYLSSKKGQNQHGHYHYQSQVAANNDRIEYIMGIHEQSQRVRKDIRFREKRSKDEKTEIYLHCMQDRREGKESFHYQKHVKIIQQGDIQSEKQLYDMLKGASSNRDIEILERKSVSNVNYLISITKQLLFLTRFYLIELERQETKKLVMKLQIDCRKLRISLRSSSASVIRLHPIKKKQYLVSPRNKVDQSRIKGVCTEKEKMLTEKITKEKKKANELNTKTSLLSNYYNVLKNKQPDEYIHQLSDTCEDTIGKKEKFTLNNRKISKLLDDNLETQQYFELLNEKINVIKNSIAESRSQIEHKYNRKNQEIGLLKKELQLINNKILRADDLIKEVKDSNYLSGFFRHKIKGPQQNKPTIQTSKSKRKLYYRHSPTNEHAYGQKTSKNQQKSLNKVKSGQLRSCTKKNISKDIKETQNNEYFLNVDSYKVK